MRPLQPKEQIEKCRECIHVDSSMAQVNVSKTRGFRFDFAFDKDSTQVCWTFFLYHMQALVYDTCVKQLVDGVFQGYNATVFAYGQTVTKSIFVNTSVLGLR